MTKVSNVVLNASKAASRKTGRPLMPPLQLYRRVLRAHKNLPIQQRQLGDKYVKNEFKLHKNAENPLHIVGFLASWQDYLHMISNKNWEDGTISKEVLDAMSPEQVVQLYELMKETQKLVTGSEA
ncbi:HCL643Cp [Eremothecium sinecaudum]|uniref:Succinate dehydrogenase assembly factor 3 n=1 Tax=Eremothecium sinecaudum TaxID=45286 RepID=A0A109UXY6_9SACH|nr:HCL643Cp [Eremothecium sinecaudum]AMD19508.1 HCL643Cp [Eremothecium sinecaudum]